MARRTKQPASQDTRPDIQRDSQYPGNSDGLEPQVVQSQGLSVTLDRPNAVRVAETDIFTPLIAAYDGAFSKNFALAPYNPDALIASKGYDEFEKLRTAPAYNAPFSVMLGAVLYKPWIVRPAIQDQSDPEYTAAADISKAFDWHLRNIVSIQDLSQDFRQVLEELLRSSLHIGFGCTEIEWRYTEEGPYKGQFGFKRFSHKRPKQIGFAVDPVNLEPMYLTSYTSFSGGPQQYLPIEKTLLYTFRPENGLPYGRGFARACYKYWWILDTLERAHAIALEVFGGPVLKAQGPFADDATALAAITTLNKARMSGTIAIPSDWTVETLHLGGGALQPFVEGKRWIAEQISYEILGQQLTTHQGTGQGSYALGEVHQHTQEYLLAKVRKDVEFLVTTQLARRWTRYNYGPDSTHLTPQFDLGEWDAAEKKLIADFWNTLVQMGSVHPLEPQIRERVNVSPAPPDRLAQLEQMFELAMKAQQTAVQVRQRIPE